ncbi:hypothetical protein PG993_011052 [Apiospora rasikravindrae]|uniref:Uncharacterized protein n=1 Tax=Apiospora rasikravindrae TaxID=990691 RepID=A0ABR1SDF9_9PEZI
MSQQHDIEMRQRSEIYSPLGDLSNFPSPLSQPDPSYANHGSSQYHRVSQVNEDDPRSARPLLHHQGSSFTYQDSEYASPYGQEFQKPEANFQAPIGTPKKVLETSWLRFFQSWPVHMLAIGSSVGIGWLGSSRVFWYPENGPVVFGQQLTHDIVSNLLQLVAKVHEIMIIFSLSAMALAMFRRRLVGDGVRLGFLTGGYRVGDLAYLTSSSFWRQGMDKSRPWEVLLCGFLVFATIMSTLVGPVSAVLLVPALGWFDYAPGTAFSNVQSPLLYRIPRQLAWRPTMRADEDYEQTGICTEGYGTYKSYCPARGFREINDWVIDWAATDLNNSLTFQSTMSDIGRQLRSTQAREKPSVVLSTTPSDFLMQSIGLMKNYIGNTEVGEVSGKSRYRLATKGVDDPKTPLSAELFQPLVQSQCQLYDKLIFMASERVYFPTEDLSCMGDEACQRLQESPYNFNPNASFFSNSTNLETDHSQFFVANDDTSLVYLTGQIPDAVVGRQGAKVYMCSMVASWIPANFTFDQTANDELVSTLSSDQSMQDVFHRAPASRHVVRFTDGWLRLLNPTLVNNTNTDHWTTALEELTGHFSTAATSSPQQQGSDDHRQYTTMAAHEGNDTAAALFLAKVFGVYLTEALARTSTTWPTVVKIGRNETSLAYANLDYQHHPAWRVDNITVLNATHVWDDDDGGEAFEMSLDAFEKAYDEDSLPIVLEAQRYGYGTGQQRKTLHFAQAIMGIYLGTVFLYAAAISVGHVLELCRMRGSRGDRIRVLSVAAWSDLQDLMMLALKTPAPGGDLADAGGGSHVGADLEEDRPSKGG